MKQCWICKQHPEEWDFDGMGTLYWVCPNLHAVLGVDPKFAVIYPEKPPAGWVARVIDEDVKP